MDSATLAELERTLTQEGPAAAIDRLCQRLREQKDYSSLFYALLLKKRHELGVNPLPTGPAQDLPPAVHTAYEDAIREACRLISRLCLDEGNIPQAFGYARIIGETEPIKQALERHEPAEGEDIQPLVHIAFYEGVHQHRGFDWIVSRFGICNAITTMSNPEFPQAPEVRRYCYEKLTQALYQELRDRLTADIERKEGRAPAAAAAPLGTRGVIRELIGGRDWLFEDGFYHIDVSHLGSVVQMAANLEPGAELEMARELCEYGQRLSPLVHTGEPPFEDYYRDHSIFLAILAGERVEEGIAHFRAKVETADPDRAGTLPAEVLVNLLVRLGRVREALDVSRRYLADVDSRHLSCPSLADLCQKANDYGPLAELARERGDAVHFVAGMIADRQAKG
jgi:hypothetical protein